MKIVFHGPHWDGSTSLQRLRAMQQVEGVTVVAHDTNARMGAGKSLYRRIRWRLGVPTDDWSERERLLAAVAEHRPDAVIIEGSNVMWPSALRRLRRLGVQRIAFYTPDDIFNPQNLKWPMRLSFREWDVFFTTKTFNMAELRARGVRKPYLIGKAFDPALHRPLGRAEAGADFEKFDLVFGGAWERERMASLNALCEAGMSVVVYGGDLGKWDKKQVHPRITVRPAVFGEGYVQAMHHGKLALCFLRKVNRDKITQRSMELTAMGRPMLAEKTDEHDAHFADGAEYAGFSSDQEMVAMARRLLGDAAARAEMGAAGRRRCLASGYSTLDRAREMVAAMR